MLDDNKNLGVAAPRFSIPFWHGGLDHRMVTDYSSLSNHLQMRWLITLAATAIIKDRNKSMLNTPFLYQYRGGNSKIISYPLRRRNAAAPYRSLISCVL